jgi:hypothetical protein
MTNQSTLTFEVHTTQNEFPFGRRGVNKAMNIKSLADPHSHRHGLNSYTSPREIARAQFKSSGVVILRFNGSPITTTTFPPFVSTKVESSVPSGLF